MNLQRRIKGYGAKDVYGMIGLAPFSALVLWLIWSHFASRFGWIEFSYWEVLLVTVFKAFLPSLGVTVRHVYPEQDVPEE